jgi:hypothetical protein
MMPRLLTPWACLAYFSESVRFICSFGFLRAQSPSTLPVDVTGINCLPSMWLGRPNVLTFIVLGANFLKKANNTT